MRFAAPKAEKTYQIRVGHFHNKTGSETETKWDGLGRIMTPPPPPPPPNTNHNKSGTQKESTRKESRTILGITQRNPTGVTADRTTTNRVTYPTQNSQKQTTKEGEQSRDADTTPPDREGIKG